MNEFVYIGAAPCGCVVSAYIDNPNRKRDVDKAIADSVRDGLLVSRIPRSTTSPFTKCEPHKDITDHSKWIEAIGIKRHKQGKPL